MKDIKLKTLSLCGVLALLAMGCNEDVLDQEINEYVVPDNCRVVTTGCTDMIRATESSESGLIILEGNVENIAYYFIGMGMYNVYSVGENSRWDWYTTHYGSNERYNAFWFQVARSADGLDTGDCQNIRAGIPEYISDMDYPGYSESGHYYDDLLKTDETWHIIAPFIPTEPGTYYYRLAMYPGNEVAQRYGETMSVEVELRGTQLWVRNAQIDQYKPLDDVDITVKK